MKFRRLSLDRDSMRARLSGSLAVIVIASVVLIGSVTVSSFDNAVEPELSNRTRLIGSIVRTDIQRALDVGIPFNAIVGLDVYLKRTITTFNEVERITVQNTEGAILGMAQSDRHTGQTQRSIFSDVFSLPQGVFNLPILNGNRSVGLIVIETSPLFVETRLKDVFLDVVVIALVAILMALELALAISMISVEKPLRRIQSLLEQQKTGNFLYRIREGGLGGIARVSARLNDRAEDLAHRLAGIPESARSHITAKIANQKPLGFRLSDVSDIRVALFLYAAAVEVSASFLPVYARDAAAPEWLSADAAAVAPLVLYLIVIAALSPFAGRLVRRFGARNLFLLSVPPTAAGLIAMGLSESVIAIAFWRGFIASLFALATISCQEYALRSSPDRESSRPIGAFVTVVFGGVFCGSAMGGVVAGRFGFEFAFLFGALLALGAGLLSFFTMRGEAGDSDPQREQLITPPTKATGGLRFWLLLIGVAAPMSAATAIVVWYLTPLMLSELNAGPAASA